MSARKVERFFLGAALFCIPLGTGAVFDGVMSEDLIMIQDVFLVLVYMLWISRTNLFSNARLKLGPIGLMLIAMMIWSCFSMSNAIALRASGVGIFFAFKSFLLYLYLANNMRTKSELLFVVNMLLYAMFFQGVLGTLQGALGSSLGLGFLGERQMALAKINSRVRGTVGYPNRYGILLIMLLPMAVTMAIFVKRSKYKLVLMAACGFGLMGLFLSLSRSSWAGFGFAIAVMSVLLMRRGLLKPKYVAALAAVVIACALIALINMDVIQARFETGADGRFRARMIDIAIPIIKSYPFFGVGLNNYQWHSFAKFNFWHPVHNEFLRYAAEIGIPGAILFAVLLLVLLRESYRAILLKDAMINSVAIGIFSGVMAFIVAINIGPEYQHYRVKLAFAALAGIAASLRRVKMVEIAMKKRQRLMQEQRDTRRSPIGQIGASRRSALPSRGAPGV